MACEFICDGCGKHEAADITESGDYVKPWHWFARRDKDGPQVACSRECINKVAAATGKTSVVLPL